MSWLYRPSTPNAPSSALIAMISGITAATTVPNAISRIANVSGIVSRSDPSRSLLTTSLICSLASVFDRPWTWSVGLAAAIAVTVSPTGAIRWVRTSPSPFAVATIRTVVLSGETSPAAAGVVSGSRTWLKVGPSTPSTVEWSAVSVATAFVTAPEKAGSSTVPVGDDRRT